MSTLREVSVYVCTYVQDNLKVLKRAHRATQILMSYISEVLWVFERNSVVPCSILLPPNHPY